jgi:hypothetical protein
LESLEKNKKVFEKFYKTELESWKSKVKTSEKQNTELKEENTKKEK